MLPSKLAELKKELEQQTWLNTDDSKALRVLKVLDLDSEFQKILNIQDFQTRSFAVAPQNCPQCGKKL